MDYDITLVEREADPDLDDLEVFRYQGPVPDRNDTITDITTGAEHRAWVVEGVSHFAGSGKIRHVYAYVTRL